ncbi:MAG: helix-turn-helix domain-containing protein [Cytophagales bacterium]|nr:helix-turn-helix domain-containing protein [Cytophagales bacterium]
MGESNNIAAIIFGISTLQGLLVALNLLFLKKGNQRANRFLGVLILVIALILFQNFVIAAGFYTYLPHLIFVFYPLNGLIGPLFFIYVIVLLFPQHQFRPIELLHFLGFTVLMIFHWNYLWFSAALKIQFAEWVYFSDSVTQKQALISIISLRLHTIAYSVFAILTITKRINSLKGHHANGSISYLNKFNQIAYLFAGYALTSMIVSIFAFTFEWKIGLFEVYGHVVNSTFLLLMAVITLHFPKHLFFVLKEKPHHANEIPGPIALPEAELYAWMNEKKYFLNPDLKLHDLAIQLQVAPHALSERINQDLNMNFYDFVNHFRIEEFKQRALAPENKHLTLLALAYEVGFNSKASFNRIFKKNTGLTPSQFLRQKEVSTSDTEAI